MSHPSFFALDVHALSAAAEDETTRHVRGCQQCAAHVAAVRVATPMPSLALDQKPRHDGKFILRTLFALGFAAFVISVAGVAKFIDVLPSERTTAKGLPAAELWMKRGATTGTWKGEKLHAGDSVRLNIAPSGFRRVVVFDEQSNEVLYEANVPGDAPVLSPSWQLDGQRTQEQLRVVLLKDENSHSPDAGCPKSATVWCTQYRLEVEP